MFFVFWVTTERDTQNETEREGGERERERNIWNARKHVSSAPNMSR